MVKRVLEANDATLIAITADEAAGFNVIPDAMTVRLHLLTMNDFVLGDVVQLNKVSHTRSKSLQRILTPAVFGGIVERGRNYVLVDDHVALGGTIANTLGFLETNGGRVVAVTSLTAGNRSKVLPISAASKTC